MSEEELDFANYTPLSEPMDLFVEITSPEPTITITTDKGVQEIDEDTWLAMVESGAFSVGGCPF